MVCFGSLLFYWSPPFSGIFQKKNSCVLEEIIRQQQELLGVDPVKYNVGILGSDSDSLQHHGKALSG